MEYLYDKLKKLEYSGIYGFHMPGHKRNGLLTGVKLPYEIDITEIDGFDDLHHAEGVLRDAQKRAAVVYHADETHYLINGSTVGLLSAVLGCTQRGNRILMARNCHKSVYNAVFLNQLRPVYIYPELFSSGRGDEADLNGPLTAAQVEEMLKENPDIAAVVITSPTYDGIVSDVQAIADCVHRWNIPLILDEAHGAHFGFHSYFPKNGNEMGADVVIHSLHKTLPSLTQTALLHMNGNIVDRERIRMYLGILQSSSPSYVLMASMDECIRLIEEKREETFNRYVDMLQSAREQLNRMEHLILWECPVYDRSKLLISTDGSLLGNEETKKYTGKQLYDDLREKYLLQLEMAAPNYAIAMTAPGDTDIGMRRLIAALNEIDGKLAKNNEDESYNSFDGCEKLTSYINEQVYSSGEMYKFTNKAKKSYIQESSGYISKEYAYIYPPGIPLIVPGERISEGTVRQIIQYQQTGFDIQGTLEKGKIEVLDNG